MKSSNLPKFLFFRLPKNPKNSFAKIQICMFTNRQIFFKIKIKSKNWLIRGWRRRRNNPKSVFFSSISIVIFIHFLVYFLPFILRRNNKKSIAKTRRIHCSLQRFLYWTDEMNANLFNLHRRAEFWSAFVGSFHFYCFCCCCVVHFRSRKDQNKVLRMATCSQTLDRARRRRNISRRLNVIGGALFCLSYSSKIIWRTVMK